MKIISKEDLTDKNTLETLKKSVFIYPTDTIYGIGCDATNDKAVARVREIKGREMKPFSVIAPSKEWIFENCIVNEKAKEWLDKLPGAYTFIFKLKDKKTKAVAENVNLGETIGVRIPTHWISEAVNKLKVPIVTTSVNLTGKPFMTSLDNLDEDIKNKVDFIIYEGEKKGSPSRVVDLTGEEAKILR